MASRVEPAACPRCRRGEGAWSIERQPGVAGGRAGCACGEVFDVVFVDEALPAPLSTTPRKPIRWSEDARVDGWTGELARLRGAGVASIVAGLVAGAYARLGFGPSPWSWILAVVLGLAVAAGFHLLGNKRVRLAFAGGRFRAWVGRQMVDVPMEEILAFSASKARPESAANQPDLVVHLTSGPAQRVQLFGLDAAEAQFVADRANALLAAGGRAVETDYRGERLRVDPSEVAPVRVDASVAPDEAPEEERGSARRRGER